MKRFLLIFVITGLLAVPFVAAQVVTAVTATCATSIDGSIVGTPNPLSPPQVSAVYSGTLPAGNYFVEEAWYDAVANVTLVSPEVQIQLSGAGEIQESPPASGLAATAVGRKIYIGTSSGSETLQGSVVGSAIYTQSVPLTNGAAVPAVNSTLCQLVANDAGWPTGTSYQVSLTSPSGGTMPGYPQQWQLLGPGNTINVSQGLPLYNGTVTYPIPVLARPYGHAQQSISGPLSLGAYPLIVGTAQISGTGGIVDVSGSIHSGGIINASGYQYNSAAPLDHVLLGDGTYYVDSPGVIARSFTTTAATTDTVTVTGMTSSGHCSLQPTNAGAAGGIASVYVSAKATNQITVTHTATATWTFDVLCVPY